MTEEWKDATSVGNANYIDLSILASFLLYPVM